MGIPRGNLRLFFRTGRARVFFCAALQLLPHFVLGVILLCALKHDQDDLPLEPEEFVSQFVFGVSFTAIGGIIISGISVFGLFVSLFNDVEFQDTILFLETTAHSLLLLTYIVLLVTLSGGPHPPVDKNTQFNRNGVTEGDIARFKKWSALVFWCVICCVIVGFIGVVVNIGWLVKRAKYRRGVVALARQMVQADAGLSTDS